MSDLVWSDPYSSETPGNLDFGISPRGAGFVFGKNIVDKFLHMNQLGHICRAHQLCMEGYQILFDDRLSTVWSAPNYCYRAGNLASILEVGEHLDRYFNVFGPCPDQRKEHVVVKKLTRLEQLLDTDGKLLKKTELESKGQGLAYSLNSDVDLETMTMDSLQYFT